jgi:beta-N-acetylhexosaminidase
VAPRAVIFGCGGPRLTAEERAFFAEIDPLGFILFARNVESPAQLRSLTADLRAAVEREDAPILIDQEGGRVARLRPPLWPARPPAEVFGHLYTADPSRAVEAVRLNAQLIAADLSEVGIDVDCAPVLDLRLPEGHEVIGDRAFSNSVEVVVALARGMAEGLMSGGVMPVGKHIPGHGRAPVDSHADLPRVAAGHATLSASDFQCFKALKDLPWMMTAHIVYEALDQVLPATNSPRIVSDIIRGEIGFDGILISDDLSMKALSGGFGARAHNALSAGCDLALHCNGDMVEMTAVAEGASVLTAASQRRLAKAKRTLESFRGDAQAGAAPPQGFSRLEAERRLDALMRAA